MKTLILGLMMLVNTTTMVLAKPYINPPPTEKDLDGCFKNYTFMMMQYHASMDQDNDILSRAVGVKMRCQGGVKEFEKATKTKYKYKE